MISLYPQRLNLAIGNRCFVSCPGCYQLFGKREADLALILESVKRFVDLGITAVTLSGGDPLTLRGLAGFLRDLRAVGVIDIKLDTVGIGLTSGTTKIDLASLLAAVDCLGVPLDGWCNDSVGIFRKGRPYLFDETVALLECLDTLSPLGKILVNTVLHKDNSSGLPLILREVLRHPSVFWWNIFQYTPTDRASGYANSTLALSEDDFKGCEVTIRAQQSRSHESPAIFFHSVRSRLGEYLLINSDGQAWIPDEKGRTVRLGHLKDGEVTLLQEWSSAVRALRERFPKRGQVCGEAFPNWTATYDLPELFPG